MTKFEDPALGRAEVYEDQNLFQIRIKSKTHGAITGFMSFWLVLWAVGEFTALATLLSGGSDIGSTVFLFAWLCLWTFGGFLVIAQVLWNLGGFELLSLDAEGLTLSRLLPVYRRSWHYDRRQIKDLRLNADEPALPVMRRNRELGFFTATSDGKIRFDYGLRTVGFGLVLDTAEAKVLLAKLQEKLEAA